MIVVNLLYIRHTILISNQTGGGVQDGGRQKLPLLVRQKSEIFQAETEFRIPSGSGILLNIGTENRIHNQW